MNHGIFMTPGVEEEWTLSIAHEQEHIDRYVAALRGVRERPQRRLGAQLDHAGHQQDQQGDDGGDQQRAGAPQVVREEDEHPRRLPEPEALNPLKALRSRRRRPRRRPAVPRLPHPHAAAALVLGQPVGEVDGDDRDQDHDHRHDVDDRQLVGAREVVEDPDRQGLVAGADVNVVTMISSKESAKASSPPATSAVRRFGRVTRRNVCHGVAPRSADASSNEPASRRSRAIDVVVDDDDAEGRVGDDDREQAEVDPEDLGEGRVQGDRR